VKTKFGNYNQTTRTSIRSRIHIGIYMHRFPVKSAPGQIDPTATGSCALWTSCGTVALYGPFFLADHRATDFTLSKIFRTATQNLSHLSTVIFTTKSFVRVLPVRVETCVICITRFVTYLSIAFHIYLLIKLLLISSSL
jgi:hypothetical protein